MQPFADELAWEMGIVVYSWQSLYITMKEIAAGRLDMVWARVYTRKGMI